jgi:uncharacterized RDD family membrane protein YckC
LTVILMGDQAMSHTDAGRPFSMAVAPHAYDPLVHPEYFDDVLPRRALAFCVDALILALPVIALMLGIFLFGIATLGIGWLLYWPLFWVLPVGTGLWALLYYGLCFGGPASATVGMRLMQLEMRTWYGDRANFLLGVVHATAYWISVSVLTPLILLIALANGRKRTLHDMLVGAIVVNTERRAESLRRSVW